MSILGTFSANLSTKCSEGAIVIVMCPSSDVRCASPVMRHVTSTLPRVRCRGHNFSPIIMKRGQNVFLVEKWVMSGQN